MDFDVETTADTAEDADTGVEREFPLAVVLVSDGDPDERRGVEHIVTTHPPAHTTVTVGSLEPRFRLDARPSEPTPGPTRHRRGEG